MTTYYTNKEILPVPIKFAVSSDLMNKFQRSFIYLKSILAPYISKNNYSRHCINKLIFDNNQEGSLEGNNEKTRVNLCVLLIEHSNDESNNDFNKEFAHTIISKYKSRTEEVLLNKKQHVRSIKYNIKLNRLLEKT